LNPLKNEDDDIDYSIFGGTPVEPEVQQLKSNQNPEVDYSQFGGTPVKEKAGKWDSLLYGAQEGVLGVASLAKSGVNEFSKQANKVLGGPRLSNDEENLSADYLSSFPESEDQTSRRLRTGAAGAVGGIPFGVPGIIAGLVGSQAGQTIREVWGNEGKFDEFGWGEGAAIGADVLAGSAGALGHSVAKNAVKQSINRTPAIFNAAEGKIQKAVIKNNLNGQKDSLQKIINDFGQIKINEFERSATQISPNRYTDLNQSSASALERNANQMFRNSELSTISPLSPTKEQGGRALQEAANSVFQTQVIEGERAAYTQASAAAEGLSGQAPRTLEEAKRLRAQLTRTTPRPDQQPLISFIDNLILDLETTAPAATSPASSILDASGRPVNPSITTPETTAPRTRSANDLVKTVQDANNAVNYGSELRQQSHRLIPIVNTLRQETGAVLAKNPEAARLYQQANQLHANNAQVWGTKYMRNVRFAENPEKIVGMTRSPSNMRNFKQGVQDPTMQALGERLVIEDITSGSSAATNRKEIAGLAPELSINAKNASNALADVKDPLTNSGGRAAVRNEVLKDSAQAINTGKPPNKVLALMQNPKGYEIVRESLSHSPQGREVFASFERLFVEDLFKSTLNKNGQIDFNVANNIMKNRETRDVINRIGGSSLVFRFENLEQVAENFQKNVRLYQNNPDTISLSRKIFTSARNAGIAGALFHSIGVPSQVLVGLGLASVASTATSSFYNSISQKILSNPRSVSLLEAISKASTPQQLNRLLPRLTETINEEIKKTQGEDSNKKMDK
jgi:hypothetical protein